MDCCEESPAAPVCNFEVSEPTVDGENRSCQAIVSGTAENITAACGVIIVVLLNEDTVERTRLTRDNMKIVGSVATFKAKVSGLGLGVKTYFVKIVVIDPAAVVIRVERLLPIPESPRISPTPPRNLRVTGKSNSSVKLRWSLPACCGGWPAPLSYIVEQLGDDGACNKVYMGTDRFCTVTKLIPGMCITFRLRVYNPMSSDWAPVIEVKTLPSVPSPPGPPEAIGGIQNANELNIRWDPSADNGSEVTSYSVEMYKVIPVSYKEDSNILRRGDSMDFQPVFTSSENCCIINRCIEPASVYRIRVRAANCKGSSTYSLSVDVSTVGLPPDPPMGLEALQILNGVSISWSPPSITNGAPVKNYTVEYSSTPPVFQVSYVGPLRSRNIELVPGLKYKVRVLAQNSFGWSEPSADLSVCTKINIPLAPSVPPKLLKDPSTNKWKIEMFVSQANGYKLFFRKSSSLLKPRAVSKVSDLSVPVVQEYYSTSTVNAVKETFMDCLYEEDEKHYTVKIQEVADSQCLVEFTEYDEPPSWVDKSLLCPRLRVGDKCLSVCYSNLCSEMISAEVHNVTDTGYWVHFPALLLPLQETRTSDIKRIENTSATVVAPKAAVMVTPKKSVTYLSNEASNWEEIYQGVSGVFQVPDTLLTVGSEYDARYLAFNIAGDGGFSPILSRFIVGSRNPSKCPEPMIILVDHCKVKFQLSQPRHLFGSSFKGWKISLAKAQMVSPHSAIVCSPFTEVPLKESYITLPHVSSTYAISACGITEAGQGAWSRAVAISSQEGPPCCTVADLSIAFQEGGIQVSWNPPNCGVQVTDYKVDFHCDTKRRDEPPIQWHTGGWVCNTSFFIEKPSKNRHVLVKIQARNSEGVGPYSKVTSSSRTSTVPGRIDGSISVVETGKTWIRISWPYVLDDGDESILGFETEILRLEVSKAELESKRSCLESMVPEEKGVTEFFPGISCQVQLKGLEQDSCYIVRVSAVNGLGNGRWSRWNVVGTAAVVTVPPPDKLAVDTLSTGSLLFTWSGGDPPYELQLAYSTKLFKKDYVTVCRGKAKRFELENVVRGAKYKARVRTYSKKVTSCFCEPIFIRTEVPVEIEKLPKEKLHSRKVNKAPPPVVVEKHRVTPSLIAKLRKRKWYQKYPRFAISVFVSSLLVVILFYLFMATTLEL